MAQPRKLEFAVAIASLRLALARRSGQFTEVIEQLKVLDASIAGESSEPVAMLAVVAFPVAPVPDQL